MLDETNRNIVAAVCHSAAGGTGRGGVRLLLQAELAARWRLSERTLEKWRSSAQGPAFLKLGGRVAYRLEDIEAFEAAQLRRGGQGTVPARPV